MASDKIINKILQNAETEASQIIADAKKTAAKEEQKINNETENRLNQLANEFKENSEELERRAKLNANLQERKDLLEIKQEVLHEAFDKAKEQMANLSDNEWFNLVTKIVLNGTDTDTEYIKVPEKDFPKYTQLNKDNMSFLDYLNLKLKEQGHMIPLKLDKNPAHFNDGLMLIGKYSDVNASFEVLIENMREYLEWDVSKILFNNE